MDNKITTISYPQCEIYHKHQWQRVRWLVAAAILLFCAGLLMISAELLAMMAEFIGFSTEL